MRREGMAVGLFFVAAGVLFFLDAVEVLRIRATYLWPLLLIGFGIALILGGRRPAEPRPEPETPPPSEEEPETEDRREARPEGSGTAEDRTRRDDFWSDDREDRD